MNGAGFPSGDSEYSVISLHCNFGAVFKITLKFKNIVDIVLFYYFTFYLTFDLCSKVTGRNLLNAMQKNLFQNANQY